jgi:predicted Zn-dependent protease
MNRTHIKWLPILAAAIFFAYQYFSSEKFVNPETGRASHVGLSTQQEAALGLQSYNQVLAQAQTIDSGPEFEMVRRVATRLAAATGAAGSSFDWRESLIRDDQVNAFCLPGGKIVVYTGILPVAENDAALATVLGHEMAHATSRHGAQRVLQQNLAQTAMTGIAVSLSDMDYDKQRTVMGALGAGAQFGILMPLGASMNRKPTTLVSSTWHALGMIRRRASGFGNEWNAAAAISRPNSFPLILRTGTAFSNCRAGCRRRWRNTIRQRAAQ